MYTQFPPAQTSTCARPYGK